MRRVRLFVAYDGTDYCGWQVQPNGITVEEVLNRELGRLTGEDIHIIGASRTDSGVHALMNVAVFDTASSIPPERMAYALNQRMPEDIVITKSDEVGADWHPRYQDNVRKTYEYHIYNAPVLNPLKRKYSAFVSFPMDVEKMRRGAAYLVGEHDFVSFCNVRTNVSDTVRTVEDVTGRSGYRDSHYGKRVSLQYGQDYRRNADPGRSGILRAGKGAGDIGGEKKDGGRHHGSGVWAGAGGNRIYVAA